VALAASDLRRALLAWYDTHARDLPWRRTRDPYAIWVSEVMLQQTRVDTVVPYYERFLARFPDVHTLAEAPEDDVLSHWSGLGYYRRARLLHAGAKKVREAHQGVVPKDPGARRKLPGIGRYTAGAIGSIAYDLPEPIVDGNVARVLSRLLVIDTPLGDKRTEAVLWEEASRLADGERPGALNQALMELGATVCTPSSPRCDACPVQVWCKARAEGRQERLPIAAPKKAPKAVALVALAARDEDGAWWLTRGEGSLFGGLWSPPMWEGKGRASAHELSEAHGLAGELSARRRTLVKHVLTHRALSIEVYALGAARGTERDALRRVSASSLPTLGISTLTRKILEGASR
jgi:A/G-specific adenine glycosylase